MNPFRTPIKLPPVPELQWFNEYLSTAEAYSADEFMRALGKENGFSERDLESNRSGRISSSQWWRLARRAMRPLVTSAKVFLGWILAIYVVDMMLPWIGRVILAKKAGLALGSVSAGAALSLITGILQTTKLTCLLALDVYGGRVASRQGRISPSWEERRAEGLARLYGGKETAYFYVIRNEYFEVSAQAHSLLDERFEGYLPLVTLYYAPRSKMMVSLEPIATLTADSYIIPPPEFS